MFVVSLYLKENKEKHLKAFFWTKERQSLKILDTRHILHWLNLLTELIISVQTERCLYFAYN